MFTLQPHKIRSNTHLWFKWLNFNITLNDSRNKEKHIQH